MKFLPEVFKATFRNKVRRRYPGQADARFRDGLLFPVFRPKFSLNLSPGTSVFTIGSCFARNVEEALEPLGIDLPTRAFAAPPHEGPPRPNGLLNEYTPGTMARRVADALAGVPADAPGSDDTLLEVEGGVLDLLLAARIPVARERALQRRAEVAAVYTALDRCDVVIITLGYIEAWFDRQTQRFLNIMPPLTAATPFPRRFVLKRLDLNEAYPLLEGMVTALTERGKKVILSVSPVPLGTTFTDNDCMVANEFSKAVLRVCAERLAQRFEAVDYFPSYEIVRSGGLASYEADHVHVRDAVVQQVTRFMIDSYASGT